MIKKLRSYFLILSIFTLCACTPTPGDFLMGTGVAIAVNTEEQKVIQNNSIDKITELKIIRALINENNVSFSKLNITSIDNNILINGSLKNVNDYLELINIIWLQPGIKSVKSKVFIHNDNREHSLSDQILQRLLEDPDVNEMNYSIEAVNYDIYLFGRPYSSIEESKTVKHAISMGINYNIITKFHYN
ncbi:MAG: hypothetical protein CBC47_03300 [Alphaproteobacteria bacterium TMED87]|nr:hypothetical protein [Rhodospirillaceae bacterium]OUV10417.1 MAG: hypothetical protein CBC47_03300 [Alphaproteobacteria bacterium TMED87]|tara:strand:- start:1372 stop:1938 length:567 start_codon:yes stop_codon:yes gene_type:complete